MIPKELLKALRKLEITTNRLANDQLAGSYTSGFKGQGLAFREVRQYLPGDDIRAIDWNVSARMDDAYIKVFVEEREMTVMLCVDISRSETFGSQASNKARLAAEVGALCAFSAIKNNDRVGLILFSDKVEKIVPPQKGQKHAMRVIREILSAEPTGAGTDISSGLHTLAKASHRRCVAFLLSDFYDANYERALSVVAARHDLVPILLADPRDETLPDVGLATFEDLETGEHVLVDTSSAEVRRAYAETMAAERETHLKLFKKFGLDHCVVRTDRPYVRPLRDLFARRAKRAHR
jgi:uncharacterized protein (DUF58 family)